MKYMGGIICALMVLYSSSVWAEQEGEESEKKSTFLYNSHGKRDPFKGLVSRSGQIINRETDFVIEDLHLEGIMAGKTGRSIAIINGRILKVNDEIGVFKVSQIEIDFVVIVKGQERFELRLKKEE